MTRKGLGTRASHSGADSRSKVANAFTASSVVLFLGFLLQPTVRHATDIITPTTGESYIIGKAPTIGAPTGMESHPRRVCHGSRSSIPAAPLLCSNFAPVRANLHLHRPRQVRGKAVALVQHRRKKAVVHRSAENHSHFPIVHSLVY